MLTATATDDQAVAGVAFQMNGADLASSTSAPYRGSYFFADYTGGWVARLHLASGSVSTFASGFGPMTDLAFGADGTL